MNGPALQNSLFVWRRAEVQSLFDSTLAKVAKEFSHLAHKKHQNYSHPHLRVAALA